MSSETVSCPTCGTLCERMKVYRCGRCGSASTYCKCADPIETLKPVAGARVGPPEPPAQQFDAIMTDVREQIRAGRTPEQELRDALAAPSEPPLDECAKCGDAACRGVKLAAFCPDCITAIVREASGASLTEERLRDILCESPWLNLTAAPSTVPEVAGEIARWLFPRVRALSPPKEPR